MTSKTLMTSIIAITAILGFSVIGEQAHASDFTAVQDGDWFDAATWDGEIPGQLDNITIPEGITVTIDGNTDKIGTNFGRVGIQNSLTNYGTITVTGGLESTSGSIGSFNGGILTNYGTITVIGGEGRDSGRIGTQSTANTINHGTMTFFPGTGNGSGNIENITGNVTNYGTMTFNGGSSTLTGSLTSIESSTVTNHGTMTFNGGVGDHTGKFSNFGLSTLTNHGTMTFIPGTGNDSGVLYNIFSATPVFNSCTGTITGYVLGSVIHECGGFDAPTIVDGADQPWDSSLAIGTDGYPVISYYDRGNDDLKLVHCTSVDCSTWDTPIILDDEESARLIPSLAIGTDGFPVISYEYGTNGDDELRFIHCTSIDCSTADTPQILYSAGNVGGFATPLAIGTDGYPVISYVDDSNDGTDPELRFIHCTSVDCSTWQPSIILDSGESFRTPSLAIGTDGYPVISYNDSSNDDLKLVHCTSVDCSTADTPIILDGDGFVGQTPSLAIGTDGYPVISYNDSSNDDLKLVHCTSVDCSTWDTPITLDMAEGLQGYPSLAIGADGNPVIAYEGGKDDVNLKLIHCTNRDCSTTDEIITLDIEGLVGFEPSLAIGVDGYPIISYEDVKNDSDVTDDELKVIHCVSVDCKDNMAPVITLIGDNPLNIIIDTPYIELGATVSDNDFKYDESVAAIDIINVDTTNVGEYFVKYSAPDDQANNEPVPIIRTVNVISESDAVGNIEDEIESLELANNVENSLLGPLKQVSRILDDDNPNNDDAACDKLDLFIANVNDKEASGKLDSATADEFRDSAQDIQNSLGC